MASSSESVARVLGLRGRSTALQLIDQIQKGLPVKALHRISECVAPDDANFKFQLVSKATLARRQKQAGARLSADEGDRVARLANVWALALDVWGGDDAARSFFFRAHALLDGRRPVDVVVGSDLGARLVEEILGRLKHGTAA